MDLNILLQASKPLVVDRDKLIKSYGLDEQLASNENLFKEILDAAAGVSQCKSAYISMLGLTEQFILSQKGKKMEAIPVSESFCQFTIQSKGICVVSDPKEISALSPHLQDCKFYAGYPLVNQNGIIVGSLCVTNDTAKVLEPHQIQVLKVLSDHVMKTLDSQRGLIGLIKKINSNFKPAACADINCLQGELAHLQTEVVNQKENLTQLTEQLTKSNKRFEKFAHTVAHDFKAPLRTIISFNQIVRRKLSANNNTQSTEVSEYVKHIESAGKNLENLVSSVLEFSQVRASEIDFNSVSLNKTLEAVLLNLNNEVTSKRAVVSLPEEDVIVLGHEQQLVQLFQNLIGNGLKYQKANNVPEIKVSTRRGSNKQIIEIEDNGIGMSQKDISKVFEPFTRLHSNDKYQGSGIGLATCQAILENHNSNITLESQEGQGTKITFTLPAFQA